MTALVKRPDVADKIRYAQTLSDSGLLPAQYRHQPANLLWALEYAEMLGLHPMAAVTGVFVIEGKPSASAGLISALVRRAGHKLRVTGNDTTAVAEIIRADDPDFTFRSEWTLDRAKTAGLLNKGTWSKYPAAMLKARAITEVARDACEDALSGLHYTAEELGAEVDEEGTPAGAVVGEVVRGGTSDPWDTTATDAAWYEAWKQTLGDATTDEEMLALWRDLGEHLRSFTCTQQDADEAAEMWKARKLALSPPEGPPAETVEGTVENPPADGALWPEVAQPGGGT